MVRLNLFTLNIDNREPLTVPGKNHGQRKGRTFGVILKWEYSILKGKRS